MESWRTTGWLRRHFSARTKVDRGEREIDPQPLQTASS
jgi:hypothetical protein